MDKMKQVTIYSAKCMSCGSQQAHYASLKRKLGEASYKVIDTNIDHYFTGSDIEMVKADIAEHIRIMRILEMPMDVLSPVVDIYDHETKEHTYARLDAYSVK